MLIVANVNEKKHFFCYCFEKRKEISGPRGSLIDLNIRSGHIICPGTEMILR